MKIVNNKDSNILTDLQLFLESRSQDNNEVIDLEVKNIISEVKEKGDEALFYFSKKFDGVDLDESNLFISRELRNECKNKIDSNILKAFETARTKEDKVFVKTLEKFTGRAKTPHFKTYWKKLDKPIKW